jgi:hypothetical protein
MHTDNQCRLLSQLHFRLTNNFDDCHLGCTCGENKGTNTTDATGNQSTVTPITNQQTESRYTMELIVNYALSQCLDNIVVIMTGGSYKKLSKSHSPHGNGRECFIKTISFEATFFICARTVLNIYQDTWRMP